MAIFPSKGKSLWRDGTKSEATYPTLQRNLEIDVAIIGAGIAGLTTAYLLKKQGKKVAVFDKAAIADGISGYTTAKVTSQHGLVYTELMNKFGREVAQQYGEANQAAIAQIETIITEEDIDCDWQRADNYVFSQKPDELKQLQQEANLAYSLGLPASFVEQTELPFPVIGAVRFANQASFNIKKYLLGLAAAVDGEGSYVFEHTKAMLRWGKGRRRFRTAHGTVTAQDLVYATNIPAPLLDHLIYSLYAYPTRSYLVAGPVQPDTPSLKGMYINTGKPTRSLLPIQTNGKNWLLVGGEGHFVGMSGPAQDRYDTLEHYAKKEFRLTDVPYRWTTWDYVAYDGLPLIGKLHPFSKHTYTATGFRKWGMTNGTVAGMILADTILGKDNPWAQTFRSPRLSAVLSLPQGIIKGLGFRK